MVGPQAPMHGVDLWLGRSWLCLLALQCLFGRVAHSGQGRRPAPGKNLGFCGGLACSGAGPKARTWKIFGPPAVAAVWCLRNSWPWPPNFGKCATLVSVYPHKPEAKKLKNKVRWFKPLCFFRLAMVYKELACRRFPIKLFELSRKFHIVKFLEVQTK